MTDPDFSPEAIAEREAKATPGPWESCGMDDADWIKPDCEYAMTVWAPSPDPPHIIRHAITCDTFQEADADFIAHARQDIPALLAALEAERVAHAETRRENAMLHSRLVVPLVVERVIDMMAAALAPSTPKEGE